MANQSDAEIKLQAVIGGARAILREINFTDSARAIFDYCCQMTGAVSGYVALLTEDGTENEVLFLEAGGMPCTVDPELPMPIRGLRASAYHTHRVVYENDFTNSNHVAYMPAGHVELRNVMFAPLNLDGRTVGIMGLANKPTDFSEEDARIAAVFGELAAIALLKSRQMEQLEEKNLSLQTALDQIQTLKGLVPICTHCKNIRDDAGYWTKVESYIGNHTGAQFSHGLCPDCIRKLYPEDAEKIIRQINETY